MCCLQPHNSLARLCLLGHLALLHLDLGLLGAAGTQLWALTRGGGGRVKELV
jgi:hypothetical protein